MRYFSDGYDGGVEWADQVVTKGAGGAFTISKLRAGYEYALVASGTRAGVTYPNTLSGGVGSSAAAEYRLLSGTQQTRSIDVPKGGVMSGTVRGPDGLPLANARIGVWTAGTGEVMSSFVYSTSTSTNGMWSMQLPFGSYRVGFTNASSTVAPGGNGYTLAPGRNGLSKQWYQNRPDYDSSPTVRLRSAQLTGIDATLREEAPSGGGMTESVSYVALGDSYQSGEGANPRRPGQSSDDGFYYSNTDVSTNRCHRSFTAYPELLVSDGFVTGEYESWACSGALIADLTDEWPSLVGVPWDDPLRPAFDADATTTVGKSAMDRLVDADPDLVTIGIGGNDMGFTDTLRDCVLGIGSGHYCYEENAAILEERLADLLEDREWLKLFTKVHDAAPDARVVVLGYPRFYDPDDIFSACVDTGVTRTDQIWINYLIKKVNEAIRQEATAAGFQFVDIYDASAGHELCQGDSDERFLHGIIPNLFDVFAESYHPTPFGHRIIADRVEEALSGGWSSAPDSFELSPGGSETVIQRVPQYSPRVTFEFRVPGNFAATLISPSGDEYTEANPASNMEVFVAGDVTRFEVNAPSTGAWRLKFEVPISQAQPLGISVRTQADQPVNQEPTARITVEQNPWNPTMYTFSAADSTDPDGGGIAQVVWDFGDGTSASGQVVEHQFTSTSEYGIGLAVADYAGAMGFANTTLDVVVPTALGYVADTGPDGVEQVRLTDDLRQFDDMYVYAEPAPEGNQRDPDIGPDHWTIAYVVDGTSDALTTYGPEGLSTIVAASDINEPEWSPDGSRLAFAATDIDGPGIFVVNADGTDLTRVVGPTGDPNSPTWTPDGERLTFVRSTGIGTDTEIVTVDSEGDGAVVIGTGSSINSLSWSPTGDRLAYAARDSNGVYQLHVLDVATADVEVITDAVGDSDQPVWHPDGRRLAFRYTALGNSDVWVVNVLTGISTGVIVSGGYQGQPFWA